MRRINLGDLIFMNISRIFAVSILVILIAIFIVLYIKAEHAIKEFGFGFFTSSVWAPNKDEFGAWPAIYGTLMSTLIAMVIATPVAIGVAIFLAEIAPRQLKQPVGTAIELLAAIPSIIYGMWGLFMFAPYIRDIFGGNGIGILTAGLVLSVMILPFMAAITRDSMNTTPDVLKESAYALGATKWDVIKDVIIPYAKAGVFGSIVLALGRALGETMAVTFVIGNVHKIPDTIVQPATNIPATLANEFAEADTDLYYSTLFYMALILFAVSMMVISFAKFYLLRDLRRQK